MRELSVHLALSALATKYGTHMVGQLVPDRHDPLQSLESEQLVGADIDLAVNKMKGRPSSEAVNLFSECRRSFKSDTMRQVTDDDIRVSFPS